MSRKHRWCRRCKGLIHVGRPKGSVYCKHCEKATISKTLQSLSDRRTGTGRGGGGVG